MNASAQFVTAERPRSAACSSVGQGLSTSEIGLGISWTSQISPSRSSTYMNMLDLCTDAELLERTAEDPQAFVAFYRRHERLVFGYLRSRRLDAELVADLAAEVFVSVLEDARSFDVKRARGTSAIPWILGIARNRLSVSIRRGVVEAGARQRLGCEPLPLEDESLARIEELSSVDPRLDGELDELPEDLRQAVIARVLDERTYPDIAAELRCSELVVRKRVSRGLSRLRAALTQSSS